MREITSILFVVALTLGTLGCQEDEEEEACEPGDPEACEDGGVCEEFEDGTTGCVEPLTVGGMVFDLSDDTPIGGARVVALDANAAPVSSVAVTAADGSYQLQVPSTRDEDGNPTATPFTLRADAAGFETFPSGIRTALPLDTGEAESGDGGWLLDNALTDIGLIPLEDDAASAALVGVVELPEQAVGVMVVATIGGTVGDAIADTSGAYAMFNLPAGSAEVTAYARGAVYETESAQLTAGAETTVDLALTGTASGVIDGTVQIVNAPGGSSTSVILVLESTFDENIARGTAPPGFRAPEDGPPSIDGAWSISGVPPGDYVVLAAFENDDLVRDPDPSIGGTQIQHVSLAAGQTHTCDGFKITEALEIFGPGAEQPEAVEGAPTFRWADDSSEDQYDVVVYDAYGNLVWETSIAGTSGQDPEVTYAGGALEAGMYYQFRVTSIKDGDPKATTEDLRGVFYVP